MTFRRAGKAGAVVAMVMAATLIQPTSAASAAGGDWLDGSYGSAGTTILPDELGFYPHYSTDSADRLYVLTGTFGETRLRRLTPNGTVDPTFAGGLLTVASPAAYGVHADAGGTVTIVGPDAVGAGVARVSRFTSAGVPDPGFGSGGSATVAGIVVSNVFGFADRAGGGLIVGIINFSTGPPTTYLVALTGAGTLDTSWAPAAPQPGVLVLSMNAASLSVDGTAVVVLGASNGTDTGQFLLRLTSAGAPDASFGPAGKFALPAEFTAKTATVGAGGYLVAGDRAQAPVVAEIAKVLPTGTLDPAFGTGGIAKGPTDPCDPTVVQVAVTAGQLYTTGYHQGCNGIEIVFEKFSQSGVVDTSFGSGGTLSLDSIGGRFFSLEPTMAPQSDGRLVAVAGVDSDLVAFRLRNDAAPPAAGSFVALTPSRLLDTRSGNGAPAAAIPPGGSIDLQVTGRGGVPSTNVGAVVLNVTVTQPASDGNIVVYPTGSPVPLASNLNFLPGQTIPNLVSVKVGDGGKVTLKNNSTGTVQLVADVAGYYRGGTATEPGMFAPLTPARILDTRNGNGAPMDPVAAGGTVALQVTGRGGVPSGNVSAVVLNVTVTQPSWDGTVVAYPTGVPAPLASNLNFVAGQTIPNLVTVKVGTGGTVTLKNNSIGTVHLVADVAGYYLGGTPVAPGAFVPVTPQRLLDTRTAQFGAAPIPAGGQRDLKVSGTSGLVPPSAAVVLNVTVTQPSWDGTVVVYPFGATPPLASNLNFVAGQTIPNLVFAKVGDNGSVTLKNNSFGTVQLVADLAGFFLN